MSIIGESSSIPRPNGITNDVVGQSVRMKHDLRLRPLLLVRELPELPRSDNAASTAMFQHDPHEIARKMSSSVKSPCASGATRIKRRCPGGSVGAFLGGHFQRSLGIEIGL
jgi:hypothetical protein